MSLEIMLEEYAFINMITSGIECYDDECIGYLFGEYQKENELYVIKNSLVSVTARMDPESVMVTDDFNSIIEKYVEKDLIIGDYHTHTGGPIQYSEEDLISMNDHKDWIYLILGIRENHKKHESWRTRSKQLIGSFFHRNKNYLLKFAGYSYFGKDKKFKSVKVTCPFAETLDNKF